MARHVAALARLFLAWGAFSGIAAAALAAFALAAALIALNPDALRPGTEVAAGITAATLFLVAACAAAWAAAHVAAARGLGRRYAWARHLALVLAPFDLLLLPLGTALSLYAFWVLLHEDARRMFVSPADADPLAF